MRLIRLVVLAALLALFASAFSSLPAAAHTGFQSSEPVDGQTVREPVDVVRLVFTGEAEPTGTGFEALDPTGQVRTPVAADSDDGITWLLRFDPPLGGGTVGIRWMVKAPDAHPIDGGFSFTITSAVASNPNVPSNTVDGGATGVTDDGEGAAPPRIEAEPPPVVDATMGSTTVATTADLDAFLDTEREPTALAARLGAIARLVTLAGTLLGVGALIFAWTVLRGEHRDVGHVLTWVRRAGVFAILGVIGELAAQVTIEAGGRFAILPSPDPVADVLLSSFGAAVALRLVGGAALATGARLDLTRAAHVGDPRARVGELTGVGAVRSDAPLVPGGAHPPPDEDPSSGGHRAEAWRPAISLTAVAGAVALVAAHLFDGHTVVKGHRFWTGVADVLHVLAGAVWVGGVVMLAVVLWRRHRRGHRPRALMLALRFSVVAALALATAGLAGLALTVIVLDSPSELWSTEWGQTLVVKTALVVMAAAAGGYNHRFLLPELASTPDDPALVARFRTVVTFEAMILVSVIAATALLMGAES